MNTNGTICDKTTNNISILLDQFVTSWNEKNIDCFGALFTETAEFTDTTGKVVTGREEIKKLNEIPLTTTQKKAELKLKGIYARALSETLVIVTAKWDTTENLDEQGNEAQNRNGVIQIIATKTTDSGYRIVLVHNTDLTLSQMAVTEAKQALTAVA